MKLRLIALAAVAAVGSAHALTPSQLASYTSAGTLKTIHIAGASAQTPMLGAFMVDYCQAGTYDRYNQGTSHFAYSCLLDTTNVPANSKGQKLLGNFAHGTPILVTKRDAGGSVFGVNPLAQGVQQDTLSIDANCTTTGSTPDYKTSSYTCPVGNVVQDYADIGLSDVEPQIFQYKLTVGGVVKYPNLDPLANGVPLTSTELGNLDVGAVNQTLFGVAVNKKLRDAMQTAQGLTAGSDAAADQPSMPRAFYAAAVSGFARGNKTGYVNWSNITGVAADAAMPVNVCRRQNGSGTQASSNLFFTQAGIQNNTTVGMLAPMDPTVTSNVVANWTSTELNLIGNSGTGDVETCLTNANAFATKTYAMGVISMEKDPGTKNYRFVKIDGAAPTQANARAGQYGFVYAATMQFPKAGTHPASKDAQAFAKSIRGLVGTPNVIAKLDSPAPRQGVLAPAHLWNTTEGCFTTTNANDLAYGSCVERQDGASPYNFSKYVLGASAQKTNSAAPLHMVR